MSVAENSSQNENIVEDFSTPLARVLYHLERGMSPRALLSHLLPSGNAIPEDLDDLSIIDIICELISEPVRRHRLTQYSTLEDAVSLIKKSENIVVLTGAGVSVSSGIPDFRSSNGIYARLKDEYKELPNPQSMFDLEFFRNDQRPFFKFAKEIYPGKFKPSLCHRFIKLLEENKHLLRNYTQNIDTLEQIAGIQNFLQCHGSFSTATCIQCKHRVSGEDIRDEIENQIIPRCTKCNSDSVLKPDIIFFGESLPEEFHELIQKDKDKLDLLVVIGSSLKVKPVAMIPQIIDPSIPQILINKERLPHYQFDVELIGDCDSIVNQICLRLGDGFDSISTGVNNFIEYPFSQIIDKYTNDYRNSLEIKESKEDPTPQICNSDSSVNAHISNSEEDLADAKKNSPNNRSCTDNPSLNNLPQTTAIQSDVKPTKEIVDTQINIVENSSSESLSIKNDCESISQQSNYPAKRLPEDSISDLQNSHAKTKRVSLSIYLPADNFCFCKPNVTLFPNGDLFCRDIDLAENCIYLPNVGSSSDVGSSTSVSEISDEHCRTSSSGSTTPEPQ